MSTPLRDFIGANLSALFRGRLFQRHGHLPPAGHRVPEGFVGVGVATNTDPATDAAVLRILEQSGIRRVRLDYTYGDHANHVARFLEALLASRLKVTLHLVQPYDAARNMPAETAVREWREFVLSTLDRFGSRIDLLEAGSTVNRKRWAGYSLDGFLAAWQVVHEATRQRSITLAGPSVTDFEPVWNIGLLRLLRDRNLLPDIHTDNLFSERCTEPERWDHKILGNTLAPLLRFNLVRKARLLQRIGADFGVPRLMSPSAFWTLPRIERLLPDSEQKQADYLSRYMVLCAASGALEAAWWGPLVCHREGLVDDGELPYPKLERITHYRTVDGASEDFRARPALAALAAFARIVPGSIYEGRLNDGQGLEIHAFRSGAHLIHVAWTINGRAAALCDAYSNEDLAEAEWIDRDGGELREAPTVLTESPIYLRWPATRTTPVRSTAAPIDGLVVHRHMRGLNHHFYRDDTWRGMVLAASRADADSLIAGLHPERITPPPAKHDSLRLARNAVWLVQHPLHPARSLVAKKPVKHHFHKKILDRLKPSKARRSWNGTVELLRRGIDAAHPVAWFESRDGADITHNWYICEHLTNTSTATQLLTADDETACEAATRLAGAIRRMHDKGIEFRDLSGGNVLVENKVGPRESADCPATRIALIDTARIRTFRRPLTDVQRASDLTRLVLKAAPHIREVLLATYFAPRPVPASMHLQIRLYRLKTSVKRRIRKLAIYKKLKT